MSILDIEVIMENKTKDKPLSVRLGHVVINGIQVDTTLHEDIDPGKTRTALIQIPDYTLGGLKISQFTDIAFPMAVSPADNILAKALMKNVAHIYPKGKAQAIPYVRPKQPTDQVLLDNKDFSIIVTSYGKPFVFDYGMRFYLVNKTKTRVSFVVEKELINGKETDAYMRFGVFPGLSKFGHIGWSKEDLKAVGITDIKEIKNIVLKFRISDEDQLSSPVLLQKDLTFKVP